MMTDTVNASISCLEIVITWNSVRQQIRWDALCAIDRMLWDELSLVLAPFRPDSARTGMTDEIISRIRGARWSSTIFTMTR